MAAFDGSDDSTFKFDGNAVPESRTMSLPNSTSLPNLPGICEVMVDLPGICEVMVDLPGI